MGQVLRSTGIAAALVLSVALAPSIGHAQSGGKTLKFIPEADLRSLDPIWTTAYITRNYGYMVYDTLFAIDANYKVQPQMVDSWKVSGDQLTYTFTLRDGLKWHDGMPVRSADCIASLQRWMKRDVFGQVLPDVIAEMKAVDDKSFQIILKKPFPLLLDAIGKLSSNVPFMMPERVAKTDANTQITESIGSGPFKFVKEEWVPGAKAVFVKNADYVPRKEPPSWAAGGKVVKVDKVEWDYIPDAQTAANALTAGEVDWWQQLPQDLVPLLAKDKNITVANADPLGSIGVLRFNHELPPFDNVKMRQAVMWAIDQKEFMTALAGNPEYWKVCYSYFACGTPLAEALQDGKREGRRLAGAGLRHAEHVASGQQMRNGRGLDRRRRLIIVGAKRALQRLDQRELGKGRNHGYFRSFVLAGIGIPWTPPAIVGSGSKAASTRPGARRRRRCAGRPPLHPGGGLVRATGRLG
jgi:peptide/nickel transport system substrate-binding protein